MKLVAVIYIETPIVTSITIHIIDTDAVIHEKDILWEHALRFCIIRNKFWRLLTELVYFLPLGNKNLNLATFVMLEMHLSFSRSRFYRARFCISSWGILNTGTIWYAGHRREYISRDFSDFVILLVGIIYVQIISALNAYIRLSCVQ